jgi:hypothetical protein
MVKVSRYHSSRRHHLDARGVRSSYLVQRTTRQTCRWSKKWPLSKGPSSAFLVVVMMATMLDNDHAPRAMITPVSIMVSVTPHFDTHTAVVTITISVHFASVTITVIAIDADADAKLFGACDGGSSNRNSS